MSERFRQFITSVEKTDRQIRKTVARKGKEVVLVCSSAVFLGACLPEDTGTVYDANSSIPPAALMQPTLPQDLPQISVDCDTTNKRNLQDYADELGQCPCPPYWDLGFFGEIGPTNICKDQYDGSGRLLPDYQFNPNQ